MSRAPNIIPIDGPNNLPCNRTTGQSWVADDPIDYIILLLIEYPAGD